MRLDPDHDEHMDLLNEKCHELRKQLGLAPDHMHLTLVQLCQYLGILTEVSDAGERAAMIDDVVEIKILRERQLS